MTSAMRERTGSMRKWFAIRTGLRAGSQMTFRRSTGPWQNCSAGCGLDRPHRIYWRENPKSRRTRRVSQRALRQAEKAFNRDEREAGAKIAKKDRARAPNFRMQFRKRAVSEKQFMKTSLGNSSFGKAV